MPYGMTLLRFAFGATYRCSRRKILQSNAYSLAVPISSDDDEKADVTETGQNQLKKDPSTDLVAKHLNKHWPVFKAFFDHYSTWGKSEVKTGRPWRLDELRIKSNSDLHKLWFVLLKERNALLTMQAEAKRLFVNFPSEERLFKVEESMQNLEQVVAERNDAYLELETGRSGRRPNRRCTTILGFHEEQPLDEHAYPANVIPKKKKRYELPYLSDDAYTFQKLYKEKLQADKRDAEDDAKRRASLHRHRYKY